MLVFQDVSCSFSAQKPSPWDNRADSRGHQRRCPTCSIFQAWRWKWWKPCCFNIFKWASSDKKTLAMVIVVMINQMSYLVFLSSFILCLWRASNYMAHCLQVQLDDFSQSASADVGSVLLKLSNLFFVLHKSIYFSNFPKCVEKPSPKFPKV